MLTQIEGFDATASGHPRRKTYGVKVGHVARGRGRAHRRAVHDQYRHGGHRDDAEADFGAGRSGLGDCALDGECCRKQRRAVPEIKRRMLDAGCIAPIIGDFHYKRARAADESIPNARKALDKYRINPGNVGAGQRRDEQFSTICKIAVG